MVCSATRVQLVLIGVSGFHRV